MNAHVGALVKAAFTFKATQIKQAASHYVEDRVTYTKHLAIGYAVAAGLFAVGALFLIGAGVIGMIALYVWLEPQFGVFDALGLCAGLLLALTLICVVAAILLMRRRSASYPSLGNRLGSALKGNPLAPAIKASRDNAAKAISTIAETASAATTRVSETARHVSDAREGPRALRRARRTAMDVLRSPPLARHRQRLPHAGLMVGASLLGWAMVRRRRNEFMSVAPKR